MLLLSLLLATPFVIFWLWLVILPAVLAILCPDQCVCDTAEYSVHCHGPLNTTVPLIPVNDVGRFFISDCNKTLLERDSFVSMPELKSLAVWNCELRAIQLGAFNGLKDLTDISVCFNFELSVIKPGTFESLRKLERLDFSFNRLEYLDVDLFTGLVNLKEILLLSNNLQRLHSNTFLGLPNIGRLSLQGNQKLQIPTDRPFINSNSLSHLDIAGCNVSSLSVKTFTNVSALERLDLALNKLKTVDINILRALPKLSKLSLFSNPLQCDCQLKEVWRWCEERNIETGCSWIVPTCDTPSEVKGMCWGVLGKGECLDGNIQYYGDCNTTIYNHIQFAYSDSFENALNLRQYQIIIYAVPFIFGTTANVILLIIIICNKDMRTVPNMYILNLAISDIIYLTLLFSEACANRILDTCLEDKFLCTFLPFCRRLSVGLSAYSVAVLSIQRYRVTVNPLHVHVHSPPSWRVTVATVCGVWIIAAFFAVPSAISQYLCKVSFFAAGTTYYKRVVIFELLVSCVLPFCVIAFTYIMTARHLVNSSRLLSDGTQNPQLETRRTTAKVVVGLTVVFLIGFVPYHAVWVYVIYTEKERHLTDMDSENFILSNNKLQYVNLISTGFLLIYYCLNPVALFCTSSQFRHHLKHYLHCFCKTNSPSADLELTRRN
jgi:hypothetical protein